jgi:HD-GYP domain-containing protein (c-di-GMP phosphodiesterase class II)
MVLTEKDFHEFIESFIEILETKDTYTRGHSNRVAHYSVEIAKEMGLSKKEIDLTHISGHLHDIGKIGIPDIILGKEGRLSDCEFEKIKMHSSFGYNILNKVSVLKEHAVIVKHHHEKWDGSGYPSKLKGKEIPLISRIISVADAFDAMTSNRSYRASLTLNHAVEELKKNSWSQFDGEVVDIFLKKVIPSLKKTMILEKTSIIN